MPLAHPPCGAGHGSSWQNQTNGPEKGGGKHPQRRYICPSVPILPGLVPIVWSNNQQDNALKTSVARGVAPCARAEFEHEFAALWEHSLRQWLRRGLRIRARPAPKGLLIIGLRNYKRGRFV